MGKDYLGKDQRRTRDDDKEPEKDFKALDEGDIRLLKSYGQGPYTKAIKVSRQTQQFLKIRNQDIYQKWCQ